MNEQAKHLVAGVATAEITPLAPVFLCGHPYAPRMSTGVHDPLLSSAMYLENRGNAALLMSLDILFLSPADALDLRARISAAAGVPEANVIAGCTHTHSGPVTVFRPQWDGTAAAQSPDPGYIERIKLQAVEAATKARSLARPARLAWTSADAAGVGGNRLSPDGLTDSETRVLAVRDARDGSLFGLVLEYGMHPAVLNENSTLVSSDFPHYTRKQLQTAFGPELVVLYFNGPSGNQSPQHFVKGQTFAEAERLGRQLGATVVGSVELLGDAAFEVNPELQGGVRKVSLPRRQFPRVEAAESLLKDIRVKVECLKAEKASAVQIRAGEYELFGAEEGAAMARMQAQGRLEGAFSGYGTAEVQALRIGTACMAGLPGELAAEYGIEIKRRAAVKSCVASLVNGELQGHIATPAADAEGGCEASCSLFRPEAGGLMVDAALALIESLSGLPEKSSQKQPAAAGDHPPGGGVAARQGA